MSISNEGREFLSAMSAYDRLLARIKARDDEAEASAFASFIAVISESTDRERELFSAGFQAGRDHEHLLWREER